jgi:addiction module RelB/DinJ family antitoxin
MKTLINIKTDREVKISAQKLAKELGLSLSAVVNAYLKQFVRSQAVDFSVAPQMTPKLEKLLDQVEYDLARGKNISGPFDSVDEFVKSLKAPDKFK